MRSSMEGRFILNIWDVEFFVCCKKTATSLTFGLKESRARPSRSCSGSTDSRQVVGFFNLFFPLALNQSTAGKEDPVSSTVCPVPPFKQEQKKKKKMNQRENSQPVEYLDVS